MCKSYRSLSTERTRSSSCFMPLYANCSSMMLTIGRQSPSCGVIPASFSEYAIHAHSPHHNSNKNWALRQLRIWRLRFLKIKMLANEMIAAATEMTANNVTVPTVYCEPSCASATGSYIIAQYNSRGIPCNPVAFADTLAVALKSISGNACSVSSSIVTSSR